MNLARLNEHQVKSRPNCIRQNVPSAGVPCNPLALSSWDSRVGGNYPSRLAILVRKRTPSMLSCLVVSLFKFHCRVGFFATEMRYEVLHQ